MRKVVAGILSTGLCCAFLVACVVHRSTEFTFYGRIERIEGRQVTLLPGHWQDNTFVPAADGGTVTFTAARGLVEQPPSGNGIALPELRAGMIVRFTVTIDANVEERLTRLEVLYQPE